MASGECAQVDAQGIAEVLQLTPRTLDALGWQQAPCLLPPEPDLSSLKIYMPPLFCSLSALVTHLFIHSLIHLFPEQTRVLKSSSHILHAVGIQNRIGTEVIWFQS